MKQLGDKIGLTHSSLSQIENEVTNASKKTLIALAKALGDNFGESWLDEYINAEETPKSKKEIAQEMSIEEYLSLKFEGKDVRRSKEKIAAVKLILADEIEDIEKHGY